MARAEISLSGRISRAFAVVLLTLGAVAPAKAAGSGLPLSADLRKLLQAEMQGVAGGMQGIVGGLSTGDWKKVGDTADAIRNSYIMAKSLTPEQRHQLEQLPREFQLLDQEFHRRAGRLSEAASAHDPELASFYFYRMVDSCTQCHRRFAAERFPGLAVTEPEAHHH